MPRMSGVVIVGAGHGAGQVAASLRQRKYSLPVTIIGEEPWYPYQRPPLSKKYLAGEMPAERLYFKPESFYEAQGITVRRSTRVTGIDRDQCQVLVDTGESVPYDQLVLATGSRARRIGTPGGDLEGIHYLRGIGDVDAIREGFVPGRRIAIVGAGYIGLEVAAVAATAGLDVTVIEMAERVMSRVVSVEISEFYQRVHHTRGVDIRLSTSIEALTGPGVVDGVTLSGGEHLPADIVVVGIGIVPNVELASGCGLDTDDGIVVDDHCRTSDPLVYAIGDCTRHPNALLGRTLRLESVHNALEQAKTAAANICGDDLSYAQVPWFWSDQYDLKLQIAGLAQGYDETVIRGDPEAHAFACLYLREGRFIAIDAINRPKDFIQAKPLIAAHAEIPPAMLADVQTDLKDLA
jgi:3-phenylpropionate/trans-cinnamate dioxygenase ferredoxin reductase subunit